MLKFGIDRFDGLVSRQGLLPLLLNLPRLFSTCLQFSFIDVPFMDEDVEPGNLPDQLRTRASPRPFHFILVKVKRWRFGITPVKRQLAPKSSSAAELKHVKTRSMSTYGGSVAAAWVVADAPIVRTDVDALE